MKEIIYPKRLVGDEGEVGGGGLLPQPLPRDAGAAQELPVAEAGRELQGHVVGGLLLLWGPAAGQTHVEAEGGGSRVRGGFRHMNSGCNPG